MGRLLSRCREAITADEQHELISLALAFVFATACCDVIHVLWK